MTYDLRAVADHGGLRRLAAREVHKYSFVLLACGVGHAEMALVFALTGWPVAAFAATIVLAAIIVGLAWWARGRTQALKLAAPASRLLWGASSVVWVLSHVVFFGWSLLWIWWVATVLFLAIGVAAFFVARQQVREFL